MEAIDKVWNYIPEEIKKNITVSKFQWYKNGFADVVIEQFMDILDDKIHEAKDMLIERFEWICSQKPESAKFMYENNVMAGYDGKEIRSASKHGTLAVGQPPCRPHLCAARRGRERH